MAASNSSPPDSPALSAEFLSLLRAAISDIDASVAAGAAGAAALLRLVASALDRASERDLDMLASVGVAIEIVGRALIDRGLRA